MTDDSGQTVVKEESTSVAEVVPVLKFSQAFKQFSTSLKTSFEEKDIEWLVETNSELVTSDKDNKKLTLDQVNLPSTVK